VEITIKQRLKDFIRPLSDLEYSQLETNILQDGCREPLSLWKHEGLNILLDGHNRYKICNKNNVKFSTLFIESVTVGKEDLPLDSIERAQMWVAQNQNGRRNLDANDRAALGAQLVPSFAAEAARRQIKLAGTRPNSEESIGSRTLLQNYSKVPQVVQKKEDIRNQKTAVAQAAELVGASATYVAGATKAAGYDNKTHTFRKPDVLSTIGSGKGQTKIADVMKDQRQQNQNVKLAAITKDNANKLPDEKSYTVILADCPWRYDFAETDNRKIENQYPTMDVDELKKFKVEFANGKKKAIDDIAARDSVLFFWATAPKLREALTVLEAWGFEYKTHAIWDKEKIGMGYWFRGQHELLLVGTKGKMPAPGDYARVSSIIRAPRSKHSEKPEEVYQLIEKMYPKAARVEIFARNDREGWDSLGNQL